MDPETGEAVDHGPASNYVPKGKPSGGGEPSGE